MCHSKVTTMDLYFDFSINKNDVSSRSWVCEFLSLNLNSFPAFPIISLLYDLISIRFGRAFFFHILSNYYRRKGFYDTTVQALP